MAVLAIALFALLFTAFIYTKVLAQSNEPWQPLHPRAPDLLKAQGSNKASQDDADQTQEAPLPVETSLEDDGAYTSREWPAHRTVAANDLRLNDACHREIKALCPRALPAYARVATCLHKHMLREQQQQVQQPQVRTGDITAAGICPTWCSAQA